MNALLKIYIRTQLILNRGRLMIEFCHLHNAIQDFIGEAIVQDELDDEMHIYEKLNAINVRTSDCTMHENISASMTVLKECLIPLETAYAPSDVIPVFLRKKIPYFG